MLFRSRHGASLCLCQHRWRPRLHGIFFCDFFICFVNYCLGLLIISVSFRNFSVRVRNVSVRVINVSVRVRVRNLSPAPGVSENGPGLSRERLRASAGTQSTHAAVSGCTWPLFSFFRFVCIDREHGYKTKKNNGIDYHNV